MKKNVFFIFVLFAIGANALLAQNLQLHFDPRSSLHGKDDFPRNYVTATFEMFKADKWGSTFMFVDADFSMSKGNLGLMYTEISRDQNLGKLPIKAHVEYNGGLGRTDENFGFSIESAYLGGVSYPFTIGKFNINTYIAYKLQTFDKTSHDVQWTFTWGANFFDDKLTVSGFFDIWTEDKMKQKEGWKSGKKFKIITEPQFWYNLNSNLSFGTEIEISDNFYTKNRGYVNPTIAAKWNF